MHARFRLHLDFYDPAWPKTLELLCQPPEPDRPAPAQRRDRSSNCQPRNLAPDGQPDNIPRINTATFINTSALREAVHQQLPLNRIATVGGNHSWVQT